MQHDEKITLLKSIRGLGQIPERQLSTLAEYLRPRQLEDNGIVFEEGSMGMSLYLISNGHIRISKRIANHASKDLVILGPGDFFGEMALIEEEGFRSASAIAYGPCILFELYRGDLNQWIKLYPQQAVKFFAELLNIQSRRLRKTSSEMTLYFDIFNFDCLKTVPEYLTQILDHLISHLDGEWSAAAYLLNKVNGNADLIVSRGNCHFEEIIQKIVTVKDDSNAWIDDSTFHIALPGKKRTFGHFIFRAQTSISHKDREEIGRTFQSVSRLLSTTLELIYSHIETLPEEHPPSPE